MVRDEHDQGVAVPGFKAAGEAHGRPAHAVFAARERDDAGQLQGDARDRVAAHDQVAGQREELSLAAVDGREAARAYTPVVGTMRETFAPCDSAQVQSAVSVGVRAAARASAAAVRAAHHAAHHAIILSPWRLPSTLVNARSRSVRSNPGAGLRAPQS